MTKINIGLTVVFIILATLIFLAIYIHFKQTQIFEELEIIKASIADIDYDIHEIEEKI